ncbi:carboxymuconolactone decarboxylase family protein [Capilliphycus salinus ALCB114379]|uniref:carboxymuconolactone decarboxylase family protein n=1 Tax=Capilliphycus salinus TaxID=2768948 RepID=UPI0039A72B2F
MLSQEDRFNKGIEALQQITGNEGQQVIDSLGDISPDIAKWIVEFAYGDVISRPGLDLKSRQIATIAALTALGNAQPQLKVHINGALNVGCTREQIIETILQMSVYAGFPASLNGIFAAQEVFQERDAS